MAGSAVWGSHLKAKQKFKKADGRKVVRERAQCVYKVWSSSFERLRKNKTFVDLAFCFGFPDLILVMSTTQIISVAKKTKFGIKKNLHGRNGFV